MAKKSKVLTNEFENIQIRNQDDAIDFLIKYNQMDTNYLQSIQLKWAVTSCNVSGIKKEIKNIIKEEWRVLIQRKCFKLQQNASFQLLLTIAIENVINTVFHNKIMHVLRNEFLIADQKLFNICKQLNNMNIAADQFGVPDIFLVPFPAAIVEFANLDLLKSPLEKIECLKSTYDLIFAELKGAIVDIIAEEPELDIPNITNEILISLVLSVIIKSKPVHLKTNLYFIKHFQNTLNPESDDDFILNIFNQAVNKLTKLSAEDFNCRKTRISTTLSLEDLINITILVSERFDRHGNRIEKVSSPYDIHLERLTSMIASATLENR